MLKHEGEDQARDTFLQAFTEAQGGRWMAVVWKVDENNQIRMHKTTSDWKEGDRMAAVGKLIVAMAVEERELEKMRQPDPLPAADFQQRLDEIRRTTILKLREKNDANVEEAVVVDSDEEPEDGDGQGGGVAEGSRSDPEAIGADQEEVDWDQEAVRGDFDRRSPDA